MVVGEERSARAEGSKPRRSACRRAARSERMREKATEVARSFRSEELMHADRLSERLPFEVPAIWGAQGGKYDGVRATPGTAEEQE